MQKYKYKLHSLIMNNKLSSEEALFLTANINMFNGSISKTLENIFQIAGVYNGSPTILGNSDIYNQIRLSTNITKKIGVIHV